MTDPRLLHRHVIRTVLALCRLAERGTDEKTREDMTEACLALLDAYLMAQSHPSVAAVREVVAPKPVTTPKPAAPKVNPQIVLRELSANARRILQRLKDNPGARTRELVAHLEGELSDRTVMRLLKELAAAGLVRRTQRDGAAVYEVVDTQG